MRWGAGALLASAVLAACSPTAEPAAVPSATVTPTASATARADLPADFPLTQVPVPAGEVSSLVAMPAGGWVFTLTLPGPFEDVMDRVVEEYERAGYDVSDVAVASGGGVGRFVSDVWVVVATGAQDGDDTVLNVVVEPGRPG